MNYITIDKSGDRIGSKAFRERALIQAGEKPFLEIGVPFLAGTCDVCIYEELRLRAQIFEVLTGRYIAADYAEGYDDHDGAEGEESGRSLTALPQEMADQLRVNWDVWAEESRRPNLYLEVFQG